MTYFLQLFGYILPLKVCSTRTGLHQVPYMEHYIYIYGDTWNSQSHLLKGPGVDIYE